MTATAADVASDKTPERRTLDDLIEEWHDDPSQWRPFLGCARESADRPGMVSTSLPQVDLFDGVRSADVMRVLAERLGGPLPRGQAVLVRMGKAKMPRGGAWTEWLRIELDEALCASLLSSTTTPSPSAAARAAAAPPMQPMADPRIDKLESLLSSLTEKLQRPEDPATMMLRIMRESDERAERQQARFLEQMKALGFTPGQTTAMQPASTSTAPTDHKFWLDLGEKMGKGGGNEIAVAAINNLAPGILRVFDLAEKSLAERTGIERERLQVQRERLKVDETRADAAMLEAAANAKRAGVEVPALVDANAESNQSANDNASPDDAREPDEVRVAE